MEEGVRKKACDYGWELVRKGEEEKEEKEKKLFATVHKFSLAKWNQSKGGQMTKPKRVQRASHVTALMRVHIHLLVPLGNRIPILYSNAIKLFTTRSGGSTFIIVKYKAKCPFFRSTKD
jgi:hypothetical protein